MTTVPALLALDEVREALAELLVATADTDPPVHVDYPDALDPPCLVVVWDDPWIDPPRTLGSRVTDSHVAVLCVAGRVEAGPGVDVLEQLVLGVAGRLRDAPTGWPLTGVSAPREYTIGGVNYLGCRVAWRVPVAL